MLGNTTLQFNFHQWTPPQSPQPKVPPSRLKQAKPLDDSYPVVSARFASGSQHQVFPWKATRLSINPGHEFAPLDTSNISFAVATPDSLGSQSASNSPGIGDTFDSSVTGYGEPDAKRQKTNRATGSRCKPKLPVLSIGRPLKNAEQVHLDAWRMIFTFSKLKFLLEAKTTCRAFNDLLKDQSIWKASRELQFGSDMPPPPGKMTEQQYADLLVGKGCQVRSCTRTNSTKIYWTFGVRLCGDCGRRMTFKRDALGNDRVRITDQRDLLQLLPAATTQGGKYKQTRPFDLATGDWAYADKTLLYLRRDFENIEFEYTRLLQLATSDEDIGLWTSSKLDEVGQLVTEIRSIESFLHSWAQNTQNYQDERSAFFEKKAAQLTPPMSTPVLKRMLAYRKAVEVNKPANEKTWQILVEKILPYRSEAEALELADSSPNNWPQSNIFRTLHTHRNQRKGHRRMLQPEQEFIIRLGASELLRCEASGVPDSNLVLACLQLVFDRYHTIPVAKRPIGKNVDGTDGPYRLSLDDARMIVEEVIDPRVETHSRRAHTVLEQLKCMGCHRKDCQKTYSLVAGFDHIFQKHVKFVGERSHYHKLFRTLPYPKCDSSINFPWYTVEWPRCLPLVPSHFEITRETRWDPDASIDFFASLRSYQASAFENRHVSHECFVQADDFSANLGFAASILKNTDLNSLHQIRIALKYALDLYDIFLEEPLALNDFIQALQGLQEVNNKIDLRFRCGVCSKDEDIHRGSKFVKHPVPLHSLVTHWAKHTERFDDEDWIAHILDLPDDVDVMTEILRTDERLKQQQDAIRAREETRQNNARMRPNAKASVVLNMEFAMDVLDRLFPKY